MNPNVEVHKVGSENALSLIRKFSRRVQGAGIIQTVRAGRYRTRPMSKAVTKKRALKRIVRQSERSRLIKEGKLTEIAPRRHGGSAPRRENTREEQSPRTGTGLGEATPIAR